MSDTENKQIQKPVKTKSEKVLFIIGIVLICIMVPILIFDAILLIKGAANPNSVPSVFGSKPLVIMSNSMEYNDGDTYSLQEKARNDLEDPNFVWLNEKDFYINKHDLIFVKESNINDYLKGKKSEDINEVNEELVGKVIAFKVPEGDSWAIVVHRIAKVERNALNESGWQLRTYGSNNPSIDNRSIDPSVIEGEWHGSRIGGVGAVVDFLTTWYGILIFIGVPVVGIIIYEVLSSKKQAEKVASAKNKELELEIAKLKAEKEALEEANKKKEEENNN